MEPTYTIPILAISYIFTLFFYRLYIHPLSKFTGPKLAAASGAYEFFFDVIQGGKFHLEIQRLHYIYGPIVRIGPNELHISDPDSYDKVYHAGSKLHKWPWYYSCFGVGQSSFGSLDNKEHGKRRAALSPFFSRLSIVSFQHTFIDAITQLSYKNISLDATSKIAFGRPFGFLEQEDLGKQFHETVEDSLRTICTIRHFPPLVPVFNNLPIWVMKIAGGNMTAIMSMKVFARDAAIAALEDDGDTDGGSQRTILREIIIKNDPERYGVVTQKRLEEEALSLIAASADTVGSALTMTTYQVLKNKDIEQLLYTELKQAIPDANNIPSFTDLEKLPYLTAVIKEGLRMAYGLVGRLPRVVSPTGFEVLDRHIPGGTVISMSAYLMHNDATIFPYPERFIPERWIGNDARRLDRYMVSFGRGSHNCVGMPYAMAQLYAGIATVHRRFKLELHGVDDGDMVFEDYFVGLQPAQSRRVHVVLKGKKT